MRLQRQTRPGRRARSKTIGGGGAAGGGGYPTLPAASALPTYGGTTPQNQATQLDYSTSTWRKGVNVGSGLGWVDASECVYMVWVNALTSSFGGYLGDGAYVDKPDSLTPYNLNPMTNVYPDGFPTSTPKVVGSTDIYSDAIIVAHDDDLDNVANDHFRISYNSGVADSSLLFGWNFDAGTFGGVYPVHVVDALDDEEGFVYAPSGSAGTITFPATEIPTGYTFNYFVLCNNDGVTGGTWGGADATASTLEGSSSGGTDHHYFGMAVDGPISMPEITFTATNLNGYVNSANGVMCMVTAIGGV